MSQFAREHPDNPFGNMPYLVRTQYERAAAHVERVTTVEPGHCPDCRCGAHVARCGECNCETLTPRA